MRDLLHVDDLVDLIGKQIERIGEFRGDIFNVGGSRVANLSLLETTELCRQITGQALPLGNIPATRPASHAAPSIGHGGKEPDQAAPGAAGHRWLPGPRRKGRHH